MNLCSNRYKARELYFLLFYLLLQTKTQMKKLVHAHWMIMPLMKIEMPNVVEVTSISTKTNEEEE